MWSEWSEVTLGDLASIKHGFAFAGDHFCDEPRPDVLVTPGNFQIGGGFQYGKLKFYDGPVPPDFVLAGDELIVTMTDLSKGGDTLGYSALVPRDLPFRLLHNQRIGLVSVRDESRTSKAFLHWVMRSRRYRDEVLASATGSTVRHTSPGRILAFQFQLPSLQEQRRIAAVLGALDEKIELNRKMNRTLEDMAQALFKSWFIDFDGHDDLVDSELGPVPAGWRVRSLDEIADFLNGAACQKFPAVHGRASLAVIKIRELNQGISDQTDQATADIPAKWWVKDGDVLFSWSGSLVVKVWTGGPGALNQHLFKVTSDDYPKWFFLLWIRQHLSEFQGIAADKATTMGHIQRHHLTAAKVLVPPQDVLKKMGDVLGSMLDRQIASDLESRTLTTLRDTLLPKLISGEIRVPEAEAAVEAAL